MITALTHAELKKVIERENVQLDLFDQMNITEIIDSDDGETRYMLCKNDKEMEKDRNVLNFQWPLGPVMGADDRR